MNIYRRHTRGISKTVGLSVLVLLMAGGSAAQSDEVEDENLPISSQFKCKDLGNGRFKPYYLKVSSDGTTYVDYSKTPKGLLGQNPMQSRKECEEAVASANQLYGVICSRTGLNGWKPTTYTGTRPGRADFGYLGGSSIVNFSDCLKATKNSSLKGVCFWGGSDWYVSPIDREGRLGGPYRTLDRCVATTREVSNEDTL